METPVAPATFAVAPLLDAGQVVLRRPDSGSCHTAIKPLRSSTGQPRSAFRARSGMRTGVGNVDALPVAGESPAVKRAGQRIAYDPSTIAGQMRAQVRTVWHRAPRPCRTRRETVPDQHRSNANAAQCPAAVHWKTQQCASRGQSDRARETRNGIQSLADSCSFSACCAAR